MLPLYLFLLKDALLYLILIITNIGTVIAVVHCAHTAMPDGLLHIIDVMKVKLS